MTLKQKALHYQNGGKYLANKEELAYVVKNIGSWYKQWCKNKENKDVWINFDNYLSLHIGCWQADLGFTGVHTPSKLKRKKK